MGLRQEMNGCVRTKLVRAFKFWFCLRNRRKNIIISHRRTWHFFIQHKWLAERSRYIRVSSVPGKYVRPQCLDAERSYYIEDKQKHNWFDTEEVGKNVGTSRTLEEPAASMDVALALVCLLYLVLAFDLIWGFQKWRESFAPDSRPKSSTRRVGSGEVHAPRKTRCTSRTMMLINRSLKG